MRGVTWSALAAVLAGARTPVQVAVLAYVGAAGLAGVTVVATLMLTPAGHVVQAAIEPARELVQSILPENLPAMLEFDPRHEIAGRSAATSVAMAAAVTIVVEATPEPVVDAPMLVETSLLAAPGTSLRASQSPGAPNTVSAALVYEVQPALAADLPVAIHPAPLATVVPAALESTPGLPVAARRVSTAAPPATVAAPRVVVQHVASTPVPLLVAAELPTAVPVKSSPGHLHSDTPTTALESVAVPVEPVHIPATLLPVAATLPPVEPTQVLVATPTPVVPPTHQPTSAPTQLPAPTSTHGPTTAPVPPGPTQKPTQTSVPTKSPTQTPMPSATPRPTVKPTAAPTHSPATATPVHRKTPSGQPEP